MCGLVNMSSSLVQYKTVYDRLLAGSLYGGGVQILKIHWKATYTLMSYIFIATLIIYF